MSVEKSNSQIDFVQIYEQGIPIETIKKQLSYFKNGISKIDLVYVKKWAEEQGTFEIFENISNIISITIGIILILVLYLANFNSPPSRLIKLNIILSSFLFVL